MATQHLCDYGCKLPLVGFNAAEVPNLFEHEASGLLLEVRVVGRIDNPSPLLRPGCLPELVTGAERIFPETEEPRALPLPMKGLRVSGGSL